MITNLDLSFAVEINVSRFVFGANALELLDSGLAEHLKLNAVMHTHCADVSHFERAEGNGYTTADIVIVHADAVNFGVEPTLLSSGSQQLGASMVVLDFQVNANQLFQDDLDFLLSHQAFFLKILIAVDFQRHCAWLKNKQKMNKLDKYVQSERHTTAIDELQLSVPISREISEICC